MIKERQTYTPTKGVDNEGYDYELNMLAFYCLVLCNNEEIQNFRVAIYDENYHPFDDIVIEVTTSSATEDYAIQLKHVKENLILNANHFNKNGKMYLSKYFKFDFTKSKNVLLFTNGVVENEIEAGSCEITHKTCLNPVEKSLDTSCKEEKHIYEINEKETSKKITFFTSQKNRQEIHDSIGIFFKEHFHLSDCSKIVRQFKKFLRLWKKKFVKLDKQDIKLKIAEILLLDHIFDYHPQFETEPDDKVELLQKVVNNFKINMVTDVEADVVNNLCCFPSKEDDLLEFAENYLIYNKKNSKVIVRILWKQKKFPLVLRVTPDNKKIILAIISTLKSENLSFLLVGNVVKEDFDEDSVFEKLEDLQDSWFFNTVCQQFKLSLQGQSALSLEKLLDINSEFSDIITTKELLMMAKQTLVVGEETEKLPEPYVQRRLKTKILKASALNDFPDEVFAIAGCSERNLRKLLPNFKFIKFAESKEQSPIASQTIILCEESERSFITLQKYQNQNIYCLKVIDDNYLELKYSNNPKHKLRQHQELKEDDLHETLKSNINLICAGPSTGKSTMLKYLRKNCPPGHWTTKVDCKKKDPEAAHDLFSSQVLSCLTAKGKRIYFYCGIDNLLEPELVKITKDIKSLSEQNFKVWVFAGDNEKETLEKAFGVNAMEIEEITEEQKNCIQQRLQVEESKALFKTPKHRSMLTEVLKHPNLSSNEKKRHLNDIFHYFIKAKYDHYLSKIGSKHQNKLIDDGIYYRTKQYMLAAISSLDQRFCQQSQQCDNHFLQQIQKYSDVVEIITVIKNKIIFCEESLRDYFAAMWLSQNFDKKQHFELLFNEKYKDMVLCFNLEICKQNLAHIAVIEKDVEGVKTNKKELDRLNRSVTELACFYSERYPKLMETKEPVSLKVIEKDSKSREIIEYLIKYVKLTPPQVCSIVETAYKGFNLFALEQILSKYEEATVQLSKMLEKDEECLPSLVFYAVTHNYVNLLKTAKPLKPFAKILMLTVNKENVLRLATKISSKDIIKTLLDAGASATSPDSTENRRSLLHLAVERQDLEITKLFVFKDAVDLLDVHRLTPLHLASQIGDVEAVELLLENGADVNFGDNFGRTPLHLAQNHQSLITLLQEKGAKSDITDKLGYKPFDGFVWPEVWTKCNF